MTKQRLVAVCSFFLFWAVTAQAASLDGLRSHVRDLEAMHLEGQLVQPGGDTAAYQLYYRQPRFFVQTLQSERRRQVVVYDAPRATVAYPHLDIERTIYLDRDGRSELARKLPLMGLFAGLLRADTDRLETRSSNGRFIVHLLQGLRAALTPEYRPVRFDHKNGSLTVHEYRTNTEPTDRFKRLIEQYRPEDKRPKTAFPSGSDSD